MNREEEIKSIAKRLWEERGKSDGHDLEYWMAAETIWKQRHLSLFKIIKASSKRIFKASAYLAAFIFIIFFMPYLLLLLLHIDDPNFGQALTGLTLSGVFLFLFGFLGFLILFYVVIIVVSMWRRYHLPKYVDIKQRQEGKRQSEMETTSLWQLVSQSSARRFILLLIGGLSALIYLIYYIGRAYIEGYYASLGIPKNFIHFEIQDYIYFGAQVDTILIACAFTAVFIGLLLVLFYNRQMLSKASGHFTSRFNTFLALGYLIWFDLALILFVYWQIFRPDLVIQKPAVMTIIMACFITLGLLILVLYFDPETFYKIRGSKAGWRIFIIGALVTLVFTPYMSGLAWGSFKAQIARQTDFPQVELYSNSIVTNTIKWATSSDGFVYKSDQTLVDSQGK